MVNQVDYEKVGLKVGLEIHQQLDVSAKMFCECEPELFKEDPEFTFLRRLRPTQSELGQVDPAAYFEFQKGTEILYEANVKSSCLVEMDEEPPHTLNKDAVDAALTAALMMKADPVDEIHVMRKTVIDGSNTTGFQRTCVVALKGEIRVGEKAIPIEHVSLEEDAARKTGGESGNKIRYRIDRLGIPLVEVATAPVIKSPKEAGEVALAIGSILRATRKVRRGLGTIRQDINISLTKGALIEIKGLQELDLLPAVVEYEVQRQLNLLAISQELEKSGLRKEELREDFLDVTGVFEKTKCKVIRKTLDSHQTVLAVKLPRMKGFLIRNLAADFRFGTELSDRASFWGRVGGIFHTDEMPAYGVTVDEVERLRKTTHAAEDDVIVFVADRVENTMDALRAVVERVREALDGVPAETRAPTAEGITRYMRPRPGAARMYPETDIPPTPIAEERLKEIGSRLPELPERRLERVMREFGLNEKLARQVLDSDYGKVFETVVRESGVSPTTVAAFLTETLKALKRDGVKTDEVNDEQLIEVFRSVGSGQLAKEALPDVVAWLSRNRGKGVKDAIGELRLKTVSGDELRVLVDKLVQENMALVKEKREASAGALMGILMKELRGRVDAAQANRVLKERLREIKEQG
jgi:glutamyl-tRNA(Gln) amidotransferase subunit E